MSFIWKIDRGSTSLAQLT